MKNDPKTSPSKSDTAGRGGAFRVAIVGAATLKGRELKEVLSQRSFPDGSVELSYATGQPAQEPIAAVPADA